MAFLNYIHYNKFYVTIEKQDIFTTTLAMLTSLGIGYSFRQSLNFVLYLRMNTVFYTNIYFGLLPGIGIELRL